MDRLLEGVGVQVEQRSCEAHGFYESRTLFQGRVWSRCPGCEKLRAEAAQAENDREERERIERAHQARLNASRVPSRFIGRTFDNFVATTDPMRHALTAARDYSEGFDSAEKAGRGLILSGMPGTGKSHLVAAILQAHMHRAVCYMTCMDLIRSIRETWRRDSEHSENYVLDYLGGRLDLLAIDEVGVQYGTDGEQTILFDVLDRRYREMRPTILLTNQDKDGFKKFIGERAYDRLTETCRWIPFDWQSYRPTARREAKA